MWFLKDDAAVPPLPNSIPAQDYANKQSEKLPLFKQGCWIIQLDPFFDDDLDPELTPDLRLKGWAVSYSGTFRVERIKGTPPVSSERMRVSGDLYVVRQNWTAQGPATPPDLPRYPSIRIFPRQDYAFYVTAQDLYFECGEPVLRLALYRFDRKERTWGAADILTAKPVPPKDKKTPPGWQDAKPNRYLCWWVYNERGTPVAKLHMGWISSHLREARIEVAVASGIKPPLAWGKHSVESVFRKLTWNVTVSDPVIAAGPPEVWSEKDLHARMLELRSPANLDREWVYHILVVPRFRTEEQYGFGRMYDRGAVDTNLLPREGMVIGVTGKFPSKPQYGSASGQRLVDVPEAAFFTLVHELGHAMGLTHRFRGTGFMQALASIAEQVSPQNSFPDNLGFEFDPLDEVRLRHYPDMWVRPGGVPFEQGFSTLPIPDADAFTDVSGQLELLAMPLRRIVPLGAPVKLQLRLTNRSDGPLPGPSVLSLAKGSVFGRVIGPGSQVHPFSAAAPYDFLGTKELPKGESLYRGETLWRGPKGPLFPVPGFYRIEVEAGWVGPGGIAQASTQCEVLVTMPRNRRHQRVALDLLRSEDLAILLIFRSVPSESAQYKERLEAAVRVLWRAFEVEELKAILAPIEALRLADTDLKSAACLIEKKSQMTSSEIEDLLKEVREADKAIQAEPEVRRMVAILRFKAQRALCKQLAPESLLKLAKELEKCV